VQASRLLGKAKVQTAVKEATQARSRRTESTADRVVREPAELAFSNIFDCTALPVGASLLRVTSGVFLEVSDVPTMQMHVHGKYH
jgi:hypothetical protein